MAVKVKISDSVNTTSSEIAASCTAVKTVYDLVTQNQTTLDFTPVQQGGGIDQSSNKIYLGWAGSFLRCTVDVTDIGGLIASSSVQTLTGTNTITLPSGGTWKYLIVQSTSGSSNCIGACGQAAGGTQIYNQYAANCTCLCIKVA